MENFKRNWAAAGLLTPRSELRILDMGGQDINGTVHGWVKTGGDTLDVLDIEAGAGVTIVGDARKPDWWDGQLYDVVISTEMLEHLDGWHRSLDAARAVLRSGGWFIGTCASIGRQRHGATGAPEPAPDEYYENVSPSPFVNYLSNTGWAEIQVGYEKLADTPTTHDLHWRARRA